MRVRLPRGLLVYLYPVVSVVGTLVAWQLLCVWLRVPTYILPTPTEIGRELWAARGVLAVHSLVTLQEIVLGFLLAIVIGLPLGLVLVWSRALEMSLYPLLVSSQTVPKVAIAPLFVLWFGFGIFPKVIVTFLICFFPITIDTVVGLRSVPPEMLLLARSTGAGGWRTFFMIKIPSALPNIFGGLKVAITLAVVGTIVAEFVGADRGLGYLLMVASGNLNTKLLFADLVVLMVLGMGLYVIIEVLESALIPWHVSKRGTEAPAPAELPREA